MNWIQLIESFENDEPKVSENEIKSRIQKIASENALRVWQGVEEESAKLSKTGESDWEWIPVDDTAWDGSTEYGCMSGRDWPAAETATTASTTTSSSYTNSANLLVLFLLTIIIK